MSASLSQRLIAAGTPLLDEQLRHPTVIGIATGSLPDTAFRWWLEQDYLFLLDYVRVFARLAADAPTHHLGNLVDLAHATWHGELDLHRSLAEAFGARLETARKGPSCARYTAFLLAAAEDYGTGLAALLPCMWGYAELGRRLAQSPPDEPRFRRWVETYADPAFAVLAERCARMLDETPVDEEQATAVFREAMGHELAFWDIPGVAPGTSEITPEFG